MKPEQQEALSKPFPKEQIQKLDAGYAKLDYVSHAWVTKRLLEVDPEWTWKPLAFDEQGLPLFDENGGLWIELTIAGVTRYGYGEPQGRDKFDAKKGAIGNALRNAAMRFGVALDLWAKEAISSTAGTSNHYAEKNAPEAVSEPNYDDPWGEQQPYTSGARPGKQFAAELMTEPQRKAIYAICKDHTDEIVKNWKIKHDIDIDLKLSKKNASDLISELKENGYADYLGAQKWEMFKLLVVNVVRFQLKHQIQINFNTPATDVTQSG